MLVVVPLWVVTAEQTGRVLHVGSEPQAAQHFLKGEEGGAFQDVLLPAAKRFPTCVLTASLPTLLDPCLHVYTTRLCTSDFTL